MAAGAPVSVTLGLLCGGRGRRLGGPKERLVDGAGRTLLESQRDRLSPYFPGLLLLTGPDDKALTGERCAVDPAPFAGQGPLAGLLAGLLASSTDWLALMPLDNPYFPPDAFRLALARALDRNPARSLPHAIGFIDGQGHRQWLPGLYHRDLRGSLDEALGSGERRFGGWVSTANPVYLAWEHPEVDSARAFTNLNTPEAAAAAGYSFPPWSGAPPGRSGPGGQD